MTTRVNNMASTDRDDDSLYASSIGEQLSPTDGYFDSRQHPREVYLNTSSSAETTKNGGASVASLLRSALSTSSASSGLRRAHSSSSIMSDETTPLLGRTTPPPAYTSEIPQSAYTYLGGQHLSESRNVNSGSPFFMTNSRPQTMRDVEANPTDDEHSQAVNSRWQRIDRAGICSIRFFMKAITSFGLFAVLIWAVVAIRGPSKPKVNTI
jgi:hypothetical protein